MNIELRGQREISREKKVKKMASETNIKMRSIIDRMSETLCIKSEKSVKATDRK